MKVSLYYSHHTLHTAYLIHLYPAGALPVFNMAKLGRAETQIVTAPWASAQISGHTSSNHRQAASEITYCAGVDRLRSSVKVCQSANS